jgi:metal-dependent amidase/aminoacylase/carboxypeptidase family protein
MNDLVRLRRTLHREPEVGLHLPRTQATILAALPGLGLEITTGSAAVPPGRLEEQGLVRAGPARCRRCRHRAS